MKAIRWIEKILNEVPNAEVTYAGGPADPAFVDFVAARFDEIVPWLRDQGFALIPTFGSAREVRMVSGDLDVMAVVYNAMGGNVDTGLPQGFPQRMRAIVQVGFIDLNSPSFLASIHHRLPGKKRRKNPASRYHGIGTLSGWMHTLNGILLKEIGLGTWQITKQPYEQWFVEGMRPSTAANIIIDGISMGAIRRRYKRKRS